MPCAKRERSAHFSSHLALVATFVALASGVGARGAAAADDFHVGLTYEVQGTPRRCWDEAEFQRSVARRLGYDPFRAGAAIGVVVRIAGSAHTVEGRIDWRDASGASMGERRLMAKDGDCSKLLTEVGFAVGLQIELLHPQSPAPVAPTASAAPTAPAPPRESAPAAPAATSPSTTTPPPVETVHSPEIAPPDAAENSPPAEPRASPLADPGSGAPVWSWSVGAGPALAWRLAPGLTLDGRLFVAVRRRNLSVELAAEATYPSTARQNDGSAFRQSLLGGTLALCQHRYELSACAVARASQVRVTGLDVDLPLSPDELVVQAGARLAATAPLGGVWSAVAYGEVLGLITPYQVILNQDTVWHMPRLAALAGASVTARFR